MDPENDFDDEIVREVRAARNSYAAQFDYDLDRIFEDLKKKEQEGAWPIADLEPRKMNPRENAA